MYYALPTWHNRTDWPSPLHTGPCKPEEKKDWPKQRYLMWAPPKSRNIIRGGEKKSRIFYGQGREVSPLGCDREQKWKFWPTQKGSKQWFWTKKGVMVQTKSQQVDRKGRGSTLTVSLTVKYPFFTPPLRGWHLYLPITSSPLSTWQKTSLFGSGGGARQPVRLSCLHCLWNVSRAWIFYENLSLLWHNIMSLKIDPPLFAQPLSDLTYTGEGDVVALRLASWNCCHACKRGRRLEMEQVERETLEFIVENVHAAYQYYGESLAQAHLCIRKYNFWRWYLTPGSLEIIII